MKRLTAFLGYTVFFVLMLIVFAPKKELYYLGEKALLPYAVTLFGERVEDRGVALRVEDGTLFFEDLKIARIKRIDVSAWLLYNRIEVAPLTFDKSMRKMLPGGLDSLTVVYSVIDPLHVHLDAAGDFGSLHAVVDIKSRRLEADLNASKILEKLHPFWLGQMKKEASGGYRFATAL